MKILSLLLMPVASLALLSNPAAQPVESADINAVLDRPEVQAIVGQLGEAQALLRNPDAPQAPGASAAGSRATAREHGLHTGHLQTATLESATRLDSLASGLTAADEWSAMFPRYAADRRR